VDLGVFHQKWLRKQERNTSCMCPCATHRLVRMGAWDRKESCPMRRTCGFMRRGAWGSPSCTNSVVFGLFHTFIHLAMSWFVNLHDFSLQNTQNTYGVARFRLKVNYNDRMKTIQKFPQTTDNSSNWCLIFLRMQRISLKT